MHKALKGENNMATYRVKQFINAITAKITKEDLEFIDKYLNDREKELFNKLPIYDRKHCINVAMDIEREVEREEFEANNKEFAYMDLIKAALLHDIGKTYKSLNPIDKSIIVLLNKFTKGNLKKYSNIKKIHTYYNHGEEGYKLLKDKNYDSNFLRIIRHHHSNNMDCPYVKLVKKYDDKN
jgi:putative nucleotidyltransferase with HDIG domain